MIDAALLVLRLWLGIVMLAHGYNHAQSLAGTAKWFESKGFGRPLLTATMSAGGEFAIGAGLVVGLLTSVAAGGLVAVMVVAYWTIHRFAGFFVFKRPDEGWEYVATLAIVATVVAMVGPGAYSIDAALGWDSALDGWTGLAVIAAGVAVAATQLVVGWRRPPD